MNPSLADSLFSDLRSPDPAIRFSVLSRLEALKGDPAILEGLAVLTGRETDPSTRFHMELILARAGRRSDGGPGGAGSPARLFEEFEDLVRHPQDDPLRLVLLLENLPPEKSALAAMTLTEARWETFPDAVLPFVLGFLRLHGSPDQVPVIETLCRHPDARVLAAAVEALERLHPASLEPLIVPLLTNPNYGIRSRAVRLLYKLDPREALRHFEAMLGSDDANDREAAMFHAYFFPFEEIEPMMLRFLGVEDDPALLTKAGYLFQVNPRPDPPYALIEVMEASRGGKKKILADLVKGVLTTQSQLLDVPAAELLERLQTTYREKKAGEIVQQIRLSWPGADPAARQSLALRLQELAQRGFAAATAAAAELLGTAAAPGLDPAGVAPRDLARLPAAARPAVWKAQAGRLAAFRAEIAALWPKMERGERIVLLQALRPGEDQALLEAVGELALADPDAGVLGEAVEKLAELVPDFLFPVLPKLVCHPSPEVQMAAIHVFALFDKRQALRLLEQMLAAPVPAARAQALFHLCRFDYPSIRPILLDRLRHETEPGNLEKIQAAFQANIDEPTLEQVYRIAAEEGGSRRVILDRLVTTLGQVLVDAGRAGADSLLALLERFRGNLEAERKQAERAKDYSLANIQRLRAEKARGAGPGGAAAAGRAGPADDEPIAAFALKAFAGFGAAAVVLYLAVLVPLLPVNALAGARAGGEGRIVEGKVLTRGPDGVEIEPGAGKEPVRLLLPGTVGGRLKARIRMLPPQGGRQRAEVLQVLEP
ncbi:MAG: HEAT repeat domain-containing protein [Candidatus Riflebacteria bacterium]|nr:HEAT repeat domain-containing protein [Candidatus Riflebacteria bacterium]